MSFNKNAVARLEKESGATATGFLISPKHVVTAKHFFPNRDIKDLNLNFPNHLGGKKYTVESVDYEENVDYANLANDIAILTLTERVEGIVPLELSFLSVEKGRPWVSFGFPNEDRQAGEEYEGTVHQIIPEHINGKHNIKLHCEKPAISSPYYVLQGASGSPIIEGNKVIAILSNEKEGSLIGAASLKKSKQLFEKYMSIPEEVNDFQISSLEGKINDAMLTTIAYIDGFPKSMHEFLKKELSELKTYFLENTVELEEFLTNTKYPSSPEEIDLNHLENLLAVILVVKSLNGNIEFLKDDGFANLLSYSTDVLESKSYLYLVYARRKHEKMPEILLKMQGRMLRNSLASHFLKTGGPIPPFPLIFDNCSESKLYNLCHSCGPTFRFEEIIKTFIEPEDGGMIKGIEDNNLGSLNEVKVLCANCIRKIQNDVEEQESLSGIVRDTIYG